MAEMDLVIQDYEVFSNDKNALAFFFYHHPALDNNPQEGPFWFSIHEDSILAGTQEHYVVFPGVTAEIIEVARQRGVLMMMEFEGQEPVRCTPCYLSADV